MPRRPNSIRAVLLAFIYLFSKAQGVRGAREIIGWLTVAPAHAELINHDNIPYSQRYVDESHKLGRGFYITQEPPVEGHPWKPRWYCVAYANSESIARAPKIHIPRYYRKRNHSNGEVENIQLWDAGEESIVEYIGHFTEDHPERVLRVSRTSNFEPNVLHMAIPSDVVNNNNVLSLWSECFRTIEELEEEHGSETINWEDKWEIVGDRGSPSEMSPVSSIGDMMDIAEDMDTLSLSE
ncbi:hypothetical protein MBM_02762 [Drepanopeziza brunnea f. sp. 'multigermtubi' MB_m1]|uniref:Uncharacterized protein n=1 Tax=Marssonina brunnea f. sp. multigermtubi (strain MB_m1) TaxID=1072389 RepID=K1WPF9_MARBU|nr:uncharacterized protein MBM_02762 [Drepanopeziza brunnea f. sp. 'multigermtubi' MB_m1]EKD19525.1 hypothetical protein MBM_02762 [Drepanopeziza brunnea f. sp. 'multigermtubi' MB_m1]